jgi:hypothetical protein
MSEEDVAPPFVVELRRIMTITGVTGLCEDPARLDRKIDNGSRKGGRAQYLSK